MEMGMGYRIGNGDGDGVTGVMVCLHCQSTERRTNAQAAASDVIFADNR